MVQLKQDYSPEFFVSSGRVIRSCEASVLSHEEHGQQGTLRTTSLGVTWSRKERSQETTPQPLSAPRQPLFTGWPLASNF